MKTRAGVTTNKIGIYYAFWTHGWEADFRPFVPKVKALGFDVLEVNAGTVARMASRARRQLRAEAEQAGLELSACIGLPARCDVASPDRGVRTRGIAFLEAQIEGCAEAGIRDIGGILYGCWPVRHPPGEPEKKRYRALSISSLREVMKRAEDRGVLLHLEVVNRFEQFLMNTASEGVSYVREVESPNCRLLLDTFHMNIEEDSFAAAIRTAGKLLGHFHLGETNRRAPGRGRIPWNEVFTALSSVHFGGSIVMEPFLMPGGEVGRDIRVYRDLRGALDLDREARRACRFVRSKLAGGGKS